MWGDEAGGTIKRPVKALNIKMSRNWRKKTKRLPEYSGLGGDR